MGHISLQRRDKDATCALSELQVRQRRRYFSTVAIFNSSFIQKQAYMYYCTVHNIIDMQHHQLKAFILNIWCENNPHVMLYAGKFSIH